MGWQNAAIPGNQPYIRKRQHWTDSLEKNIPIEIVYTRAAPILLFFPPIFLSSNSFFSDPFFFLILLTLFQSQKHV